MIDEQIRLIKVNNQTNQMNRFYFDWAATADSEMGSSFLSSASLWNLGNPSSKHKEGYEAKQLLQDARNACAAALDVDASKLYFTSGASEANAIVLFSLLQNHLFGTSKKNIITTETEHPSLLENCNTLKKIGLTLDFLKLNEVGGVSCDMLQHQLQKKQGCSFVSLMSVNNETGVISDISALVKTCRIQNENDNTKSFFHTDIVQAIGKIPVCLKLWDVDSAVISAHKIGGMRGVGLLYLKNKITPLCKGGSQEGGIRAGTENVLGAISLAQCLTKMTDKTVLNKNYDDAKLRMSYLIKELNAIDRCVIIPKNRSAESTQFSPYILQAAFKNIPGEVMQRLLDDEGFAVSTGSACSGINSKSKTGGAPRPVLAAMGIDAKTAFEGIRISQGWNTKQEDIDKLLMAIKAILKKY